MPTAEKKQRVKELGERLKEAQALVFTDFRGLTANEMVELRRQLKSHNLEYRVVKNRLVKRAAARAGLELDSLLEGPTGICFGYDDPVLAFKHSVKVAKSFPKYKIKGGVSEGQLLSTEEAKVLAAIPSREVLLAQLAGVLQGPVQRLALTLGGLIRELAVVLNQVAQVKSEGAGDADKEDPAQAADQAARGDEGSP